MAYFNNFRKIYYDGKLSRNIVMKAQFFRDVLESYSAFYPYTIKDGERPDIIAHNYYGSYEYDWLVFFSNEIVDPYFEWPMTYNQFTAFLKKKYGSIETSQTTVVHYVYDTTVEVADTGYDYKTNYIMMPETYQFQSNAEQGYWNPVYAYNYEFDLNESKRDIKLFDNDLLLQVEKELNGIFK